MIECRLCLEERGFSIFVDDRIQAGEKWRDSLRHHRRAASALWRCGRLRPVNRIS
jgi:hypothetical protein